jgi:hypothetical protein
MRCELGIVLRAPARGAPRHDDLFAILDERLVVHGVSRGAEAVLLVDEPFGLEAPLEELLISANGNGASVQKLVALAVAGTPSSERLDMRTTLDPVVWFTARVSSCGPPPAALLVLTPLAEPAMPLADRGRPAATNAWPAHRRFRGDAA